MSVIVDIHTEHLYGIQAHGSALVEIGVEQIVAQDLKTIGLVDCHDVVRLLVRPLAVRHRFEPLATMWADDLAFAVTAGFLIDEFATVATDKRLLLVLECDMLAGSIIDLCKILGVYGAKGLSNKFWLGSLF